MKPSLASIGAHGSALVVVDDFDGDVPAVIDAAAALAPFGRAENSHYPGLRRLLTRADGAAWAYAERTLRAIAPFIGGAFDADRFDIEEASFSLVTDPPSTLAQQQRLPHYDSVDPDYLAILHYLGGTGGTGTGFYRQRSTGIERVEPGNQAAFINAARREGAAASGYIAGSNPCFEQVAAIAAMPDRLVIYQGCLLHSGIIPPELPLSADPREGRLTGNFFVKIHRRLR
ncbi:DUF6445 family protein [uncultured Sphingomonas sp.]|uniref:DUF6445 family protein n=1 Tax=uncultured Sphingomonas sp. TaxID=158754 RepID=UPI0035C96C88